MLKIYHLHEKYVYKNWKIIENIIYKWFLFSLDTIQVR